MITIDFDTLEERDMNKILIGSVVPRPIAFVTTLSEQGVLNGAPFSYFNLISSAPPLLSISIRKEGSNQKDTARNILSGQEFVVHIVSSGYLDQVNQSAFPYPPDVSEIKVVGLTQASSGKIKVPGISEAKIRFECVLETTVDLPGSIMIIGRIVMAHIDESVYSDGKIRVRELDPICRLSGNDYAKIGEIITKPRPSQN